MLEILFPMSSKTVIITGIHRSGTSYLSRCLDAAGVPMWKSDGGDHAECQRLLAINERELSRQGLTFRDVSADPVPSQDFIDELINYKAQREDSGAPVYGMKDPRIASLISAYLAVWPDALYVVCVRNLISAGNSWLKRGNCETALAGSVYLGRQYLYLTLKMAERPLLVFNYDDADIVSIEAALKKEIGVYVDCLSSWNPRR